MYFNALDTIQAFEAGSARRKEQEREAAMKQFGNALANNDYGGAAKLGFQIDPALGMQARQYGEGQNALALNKQIAPLMAAGKYDEATTLAAPSGNLDLMAQLNQFKQTATEQQRLEAARRAESFAKVAIGYQGMSPEQAAQRWQQDMPALQAQGFSPEELAQFDPTNPQDINDALMAAQTLGDIMTGRRADAAAETDQERFDLGYGLDLRRVQLAEKEAADAAEARRLATEAATANPNRKTEKDQNGVLRYLDNGEPVFPNVTTKPEVPKPLIGAESMGRVAAGLPVAKSAVQDLKRLLFNSKGTAVSMEGYSPGRDFGAGLIQDVGHIPLVGGLVRPATDTLSRAVGGEDYQLFEDSYGSYEAAMLPIMSGAAVTDTEALRQMRAVRIRPGDSEDTKKRKIAAMETQLRGLEMAARGDVQGFLGLLDQAQEIVKPDSAAQPTGLESASDDDLFLIMRGQ